MQGPYLRPYGVQTTLNFILYETDGTVLEKAAAHATGDTVIMKDEGTEANTSNAFTDEGRGYSIVLTATEMQAARIVVYVEDQGTQNWLDTALSIETYGHPSSQHPDRASTGSVQTTIATLASQTSFTLTDGSADNDAYNGWGAVVQDVTTAQQRCFAVVDDYTGSTKTVTLREDPGIFTMAATDIITLIPPVSSNLYAVDGDVAAAQNLETACDNYSATRGLAGTALPAAAADAAGGLPISDAGGLDLDAMSTNINDIETDTAVIGAAGAGLTAIPWNAAWDAEVQSEVQDALDATLTFTKANELDVNVQSINGAGVVGDGNATPWDGA